MNNLKISVIIPCYNEEKTIEKIIEQVSINGDMIHEIIIIDDNSTDRSKEIITDISKKIQKLYFISKIKMKEKDLL